MRLHGRSSSPVAAADDDHDHHHLTMPHPIIADNGDGKRDRDRDDKSVESWPSSTSSSSSSSSSSSLSSMGEIRDIVLDLHALVNVHAHANANVPSPPPKPKVKNPEPRHLKPQPRPRPRTMRDAHDDEDAGTSADAGAGAAAAVHRGADGGSGCSGDGNDDGIDDDGGVVDHSSSPPGGVVATSSAPPPPFIAHDDVPPPTPTQPTLADDWSFSSVEVEVEVENDNHDEGQDRDWDQDEVVQDDVRPKNRGAGEEESDDLAAAPGDDDGGYRTSTSGGGIAAGRSLVVSSVDGGMATTTTMATAASPSRGEDGEGGQQVVSVKMQRQHPPRHAHRGGPSNGFDPDEEEKKEKKEKEETEDNEEDGEVAGGTGGAIAVVTGTTTTTAPGHASAPDTVTTPAPATPATGNHGSSSTLVDDGDDDASSSAPATRDEVHRRWDERIDRAARRLVAAAQTAGGEDHDERDGDHHDEAEESARRLLLARRIRTFYGYLVLAHCRGDGDGEVEEDGGVLGSPSAHDHSHLGCYRRYYRENNVLLRSPSTTGGGERSGRSTPTTTTTTGGGSFIPVASARLLWEEVCLSVVDDHDGDGDDCGCSRLNFDLETILTSNAFVGPSGGGGGEEENDFFAPPLVLLGRPATIDDGVRHEDEGVGVRGEGGRNDDDDDEPPSCPLLLRGGCRLIGETPLRIPSQSFGIDVYRDYAVHLLLTCGGVRGEHGCDAERAAELEALLVAVRACRRRVLAEKHGGAEVRAADVDVDADADPGEGEGETASQLSRSSTTDYAFLALPYLLLGAAAVASSILATYEEDCDDAPHASPFFLDGDCTMDGDVDDSKHVAATRRRARMVHLRDRLLSSVGTLLLRSRWFITRRTEAAMTLLLGGGGANGKSPEEEDEEDHDTRLGGVAMEAVELHVVDVEFWTMLRISASASSAADGGGEYAAGGNAIAALDADVGDGDDPPKKMDLDDRGWLWDVMDDTSLNDPIVDDGGTSSSSRPPSVSEGYQLLLSCLERWNERDDGHDDDDDSSSEDSSGDDDDEMGEPRPDRAAADQNLNPSTLLHVLGQTSHLLARSLSSRNLLLLSRGIINGSAASLQGVDAEDPHRGDDEGDNDNNNNVERNYDDGAMTLYGRALHYYGLLGSTLSAGSSTREDGLGGGDNGEGDGDESPWDWMEDGWSDDDIDVCDGVDDDDKSEDGDRKGGAGETATATATATASDADAHAPRHEHRHHHRNRSPSPPTITQRDVNDMRAVVLCHMGQHSEAYEDYRGAITYYGEAVIIWKNPNLWRYKLSTLSGNHWEDYESFNELDDDDDGSDDGEDGRSRHHRRRRHHHRGPNSNVCMGDMLHRIGVAHAYLGEFDKAVECLKASSEIRRKLVLVVRGRDGDGDGDGDGVEGESEGDCSATPALERMIHHHRHHEDTLTLSPSLGLWRRDRSHRRRGGDGPSSPGDSNDEEAGVVGPPSSSGSSPPARVRRCTNTTSSLRRRREMDLADTLQWLATCHRELGESDLARSCFVDCLSIKTRLHGRNHVEVAALYYYIGIVYDDVGRHELSLEHYQDAVRIRRHVEAAFDSSADDARKRTEVCTSDGSSRGRSEPAYYDPVEEGERMLARRENGHEMVNAFVCMGNIFLNIWKRKLEALEYFSEAIRLSELLMDTQAVERGIDEAYTLGGVGSSAAAATTLSAVDDGKQQSDYSALAPISSAPPQVENKNGEYERMLECYQILLDIVVSLDGKDERTRPSCGTSTEILLGMARVRMAQRRWDDALLVLRRKLSILHDKWKDQPHAAGHAPRENKVALEAEYENTLYVIGHVMFKLRQFDHAIQSYNDVLVAWRTKCDPDETSVFMTQIVCALYNKGNCHRELREYDQATQCFEEVSTLAEDLLSRKYDERVALVRANNWYQLANMQLLQSNGTTAVKYLQKSHNFFYEHYGRNHLGVGLSLQGIGEVHHQAKRHYRALECYVEAARVYRVAAAVGHDGSTYDAGFAGEISHFMGDALHNIGALHEEKDELDGAKANYEEALRLYRSKFGSTHLSIAKALASMARICVKQHRYLAAEEKLDEALSIRREILGTDHQDVAKTLMSLGRVHDALHSRQSEVHSGLSKAMSCYEEALRIRRKTLGEHHPDVAASWNMVGKIHTNLQEYDKAFECLEKALVLRQELLGHSHQDTAITYHNLGNAHAMRGAYGKALEFYMSAYGIQASKKDERDHMSLSSTCHNIANVHSMLGDTSKAKMWYEQALEIREKNMPESEALAQTLYKLGALELETKDYDVALEQFRRSLDIMRLQCDELAKFELASILNEIATICALHRKDFEQAIECCAEVVQIMDSNGCSDSEEVANAQNMLGYIYSNKADSYYDVGMAIRCHESALSILRTKNEASDTACIAKTLCSLGVCYVNSLREIGNSATKSDNDDVKKAMEYLNECISIFKHQVNSKERRLQSADRTRELARAFYFKGLLHVQSANNETEEKDDAEALRCFEESLDLFRAVTDEESTTDAFIKARVLQKLGMMSAKCRDYDRAMLCFGEALQLGLRAYQNDHDEEEWSFRFEYDYDEGLAGIKEKGVAVAEIYFGMGIVSCERRDHDYEKSLHFYHKCLEMRQENLGPRHMDVAQTLNNIGSVYARKKNYEEAMDYWTQALKMYKDTGLSDTDEKFKCTLSNIELAEKLVTMTQQVTSEKKPFMHQSARETFID